MSQGLTHGAFLWGKEGTGKSHLVSLLGMQLVHVSMSELKTRQQVEKNVLMPMLSLDVTGKAKMVVVDDFHESGDSGGIMELCRLSKPERTERAKAAKEAACRRLQGVRPFVVMARDPPPQPMDTSFAVVVLASPTDIEVSKLAGISTSLAHRCNGDIRAARLIGSMGPCASIRDFRRPHEEVVRSVFRGNPVPDANTYDMHVFFENYIDRLSPHNDMHSVAEMTALLCFWDTCSINTPEILNGAGFILSHMWSPRERTPLRSVHNLVCKKTSAIRMSYLAVDASRDSSLECMQQAAESAALHPETMPQWIGQESAEAFLRLRFGKKTVPAALKKDIRNAYFKSERT
jgi:hypothetical protein